MKKTELLEAWARLKSLAIARQQKLLGAHEIQRFNRYHNFTRGVPDHMFWCALIAFFLCSCHGLYVFLPRVLYVLTKCCICSKISCCICSNHRVEYVLITCCICSNHVLYMFWSRFVCVLTSVSDPDPVGSGSVSRSVDMDPGSAKGLLLQKVYFFLNF